MQTNEHSSDRADDDPGRRLDTPDPAQEFGKAAADDADLADRLTREADGDLERAESEFDDASRGPVPTETARPRNSE